MVLVRPGRDAVRVVDGGGPVTATLRERAPPWPRPAADCGQLPPHSGRPCASSWAAATTAHRPLGAVRQRADPPAARWGPCRRARRCRRTEGLLRISTVPRSHSETGIDRLWQGKNAVVPLVRQAFQLPRVLQGKATAERDVDPRRAPGRCPAPGRHRAPPSGEGTAPPARLPARRHGLTLALAGVTPSPPFGLPVPRGSGQPVPGGTRRCRLPGQPRPTARARRPIAAGRRCKCGDRR